MSSIRQATEARLVHEALVYSSDEEFLARLLPFFRDGFAAGDPVVVMLTPDKVKLLRDALGDGVEHVAFADGSAHYRRPANALAEYRRQLDEHLSRPDVELVRVAAEIPFGPTTPDVEWMRYESIVSQAFAGYPAWVVCGYDTRIVPDQVVAEALRAHPFLSSSDHHDANGGYIDTDELVDRPLILERELADGDLLAQLTVTNEGDLDHLRRVVAGSARAAGLAPTIVEDVTVAAVELARDALPNGKGEAAVEVARDGARWHCEVTDLDSGQTTERIGLAIARLIGERVELGAEAGAHTVRLTFAGAADARQRILDAASELFYQNGIRATGTNTIIAHSGVAKSTFFRQFPAKNDLVIAWLQQPASRWFDRIRTELDARAESPASRLLTFFDLLGEWFARDDFRGCAFQNAAGETPEADHAVRQTVRDYWLEIQDYLQRAANEAGLSQPVRVAEQLHLLAQGAISTAVATRSPEAAKVARATAKRILAAPKPS